MAKDATKKAVLKDELGLGGQRGRLVRYKSTKECVLGRAVFPSLAMLRYAMPCHVVCVSQGVWVSCAIVTRVGICAYAMLCSGNG